MFFLCLDDEESLSVPFSEKNFCAPRFVEAGPITKGFRNCPRLLTIIHIQEGQICSMKVP